MKRKKMMDPMPLYNNQLCYLDYVGNCHLSAGLRRVESELLRHRKLRGGWRSVRRHREAFRYAESLMGDPWP